MVIEVLIKERTVGTFDFTPAPTQKPQRIIAHVSGGPATGKTYLALTGKPPIYYINLDRGTEGVVEQFAQSPHKVSTIQCGTNSSSSGVSYVPRKKAL